MLNYYGVLLGLDQSSLKHDYLTIYDIFFKSNSNIKNICIVGNSDLATKAAKLLAECYQQFSVYLLSDMKISQNEDNQNLPLTIIQYTGIDHLVEILMTLEKFDIVIEHSNNFRKNKNILFSTIFPFIRENGSYFIEDAHSSFMEKFDDGSPNIQELLNSLLKDKALNKYNPKLFLTELLPQLVSSVENYGKLIKVNRSSVPILPKIQELNAQNFFSKRPDLVKKYETILAKNQIISKCKIISNREQFKHQAYMPSEIPILEIGIREYENVICIPGQILVKDGLMLPEFQRRTKTLGHNNKNNQNNTKYYAEDHFKVTQQAPQQYLKGNYLYLDNEYDNHFGHMLTEFIAKLWAWDSFNQKYPNGKVIVGAITGNIFPLLHQVLTAYGIPNNKIIALKSPIIVEHLVCPSQLYQIGNYASPEITKTWDKLTTYFLDKADKGCPTYDKIFVSRKDKGRACHNTEEIEALFVKQGYKVIYPENFGFAEQVKLFNSAKVIAGFGGSATINAIFSQNNVKKIIIQSDTYSANNDFLISSIKGGELIICYCDADIPYKGYWTIQAFMSSYTCTEKEMVFLKEYI